MIKPFYPEFVSKFGLVTPDYRGMFLRGLGGNSAGLGIEQKYAIPDMMGKGNIIGMMGVWPATNVSGSFRMTNSYGWGHAWGGGSDIGVDIEFDLANSVPEENRANEIRPVNKAVRYCVKVR